MVTDPETVEPLVGDVIETTGGVVSIMYLKTTFVVVFADTDIGIEHVVPSQVGVVGNVVIVHSVPPSGNVQVPAVSIYPDTSVADTV